MCYYARTDYDCRDWKWGNMMLRCPRQHRIGETCGAKLVHTESVTKGGPLCKTCEEIETKKRRLVKTCDNIQRWQKEPDKFSASLDKARREGTELSEKIKELQSRRPSIATNMSMPAYSPPTNANVLPPLSAMTASPSAGYEYVSSETALHRRQEPNVSNLPRSGTMVPSSTYQSASMSQMSPNVQYQSGSLAAYPRSSMMNVATTANGANNRNSMAYSVNRR